MSEENVLPHLVKVINTGHCINIACHQSEPAPSLRSKSVLDQQMHIPISSFQEAEVNYRQQCHSIATHSRLGPIHQAKRQYIWKHAHTNECTNKGTHAQTCMKTHRHICINRHLCLGFFSWSPWGPAHCIEEEPKTMLVLLLIFLSWFCSISVSLNTPGEDHLKNPFNSGYRRHLF